MICETKKLLGEKPFIFLSNARRHKSPKESSIRTMIYDVYYVKQAIDSKVGFRSLSRFGGCEF